MPTADPQFGAIVMAAGKGTRMPGDLPKVAHEAGGRPMVRWVVDACREAGCSRIVVVVGYRQDIVRGLFGGERGVEFVEQTEQLGTGHAAMCAEPALHGFRGDVLVLAGDGPLIRGETLARLKSLRRERNAAGSLATTVLDDPKGYGRIVRDGAGRFLRITEEKNASDAERAIREVYPSLCCFDAALLFESLKRVSRDPLTGEYYVTLVPELLAREGRRIELLDGVAPEEAMGVNTPAQLGQVDALLRARRGVKA